MEKEVVSYEIALALKELGFNEPCFAHYSSFGYYNSKQELKWKRPTISLINGVLISNKDLTWQEDETIILKQATAPLYQQVLKWFREKYGLYISLNKFKPFDVLNPIMVCTHIYDEINNKCINVGEFNTYEEAELECLRRLIEITKHK